MSVILRDYKRDAHLHGMVAWEQAGPTSSDARPPVCISPVARLSVSCSSGEHGKDWIF